MSAGGFCATCGTHIVSESGQPGTWLDYSDHAQADDGHTHFPIIAMTETVNCPRCFGAAIAGTTPRADPLCLACRGTGIASGKVPTEVPVTVREIAEPSQATAGNVPRVKLPRGVIRERVLGVAEIAELLGVKAGTVHQWKKRDLLPPADMTVGGVAAYYEGSIVEWARCTGRLDRQGKVSADIVEQEEVGTNE